MVAYSFQPQFVDPIRSGRKQQTIRAIGRRRHVRPGDALQLYTGMRTRSCRLIGRATCADVEAVRIWFEPDRVILFTRGDVDLEPFAQADGFRSWAELRAFWAKHHPDVDRFSGFLIRWSAFEAAP